MLRDFLKVVQDARENNKTIILPDESVLPSNIGVDVNKIKYVNQRKNNAIKYKRVYADADVNLLSLCNNKYKFSFKTLSKSNDKGSYYEIEYKNSVPKGYIRLYFCLKPSDNINDCKNYGVSRETWEANKAKYITILSYKIKSGQEETQQSVMEEVADFIKKKMYRQAIINVLNINNEENNEQ